MTSKLWLSVILNLIMMTLGNFLAGCPQECRCSWLNGNKQADCSNGQLQEIPKTLSTDIQVLDLTGNTINDIENQAFKQVGLINLKKLILRDCKLNTIQRNGFSGLAILIELDLSRNNLKTLHADTFKEIVSIRYIHLNDNKLEKFEEELFSNLMYLQTVDLSRNRLDTIGLNTYEHSYVIIN